MSLILIALYLPLIALGLYIYWRQRAMKRQQQGLVRGLQGARYWRVNLARPDFQQSWMRLLPFEAKGVLIDDGDQLRLRGFWLKGSKPFESVIDKRLAQAEWVGNRNLRAGNLYWGTLRTPKGEVFFSADTGMYALTSREALEDIFRNVFPHVELSEAATQEFALDKNPRSMVAMAVFFALMAFALIDTFFIQRYELVDAQLHRILLHPLVWIGVGLGTAGLIALLYRFFIGGRIPARESWALATMLTVMLMGAALPMAKRLDQALADGPSIDYAYKVKSGGRLEPVDATLGLPKMIFPRSQDYWAQFKEGSTYQVPYLRGPMGLWQLDHEKFDPPLLEFYEKNSKK